MSDEELPLYLTYRELADQELRRRLIELGATPGKRDSAETLTQQLFSLWDDRRLKQWDEAMTQALALAGQSQWPEAAAAFDRILVAEPVYGRRAEMTPTFFALGQTLASAGQWEPASVAFEKAYSLDPTGPTSSQARAELHHARAKVLAQKGQPTDDELEQALAANPDHPGAKAALVREHKAAASQGGRWMLVAGAAALGLALGALLLALRRR
jgi:tetratricopeptide (TPR) repeat protein